MANKIIKEDTLVAIADSIRGKIGSEDKISPNDMPGLIDDMEVAQSVEPIVLTGDCSYACCGALSSGYIKLFSDTITTDSISKASYMFYYNTAESIPFELNFIQNKEVDFMFLFNNCKNLNILPKINKVKVGDLYDMFSGCVNLRVVPDDYFDNIDFSYINNATTSTKGKLNNFFKNCYSLRKFPVNVFKNYNYKITQNFYSHYYNTFDCCRVLDEIRGMPVVNAEFSGNAFASFISNCARLAEFTFEVNNDGSPKTAKWKNQTVDVSTCGYFSMAYWEQYITDYNHGITMDKQVKDDATYQALKNNPDWFTTSGPYSRFNHSSVVNTINSLPDTSAYLATAGGTNTIKFRNNVGERTDGGSVSNLTAEEIAVATAKGWTVSLI